MQELIEYIAKSIVDNPEAVVVEEVSEDNDRLVFKLHVAPEDMGKVIGRQGRIARSMRTLLKVAAVRQGFHASLEIE